MRYLATAIVSIIFSAGISVGITHSVMSERAQKSVEEMEVDAFNDGFRYGACNEGFDGWGTPCK